MAVYQTLKKDSPSTDELDLSWRSYLPQVFLYSVGVCLVVFLNSPADPWGGPSAGELVDTDGYMRYLRIEDLADGGDWYDSTTERSNYPFGESQHWTRPLDLYILGISAALTPVLDDGALYWAAVINAPLLLITTGIALYAAFRLQLPQSTSRLAMFLVLGLAPVTSYAKAGRVDHHLAILLIFVLAIGGILRLVRLARRPRVWAIAVTLVMGVWLSTEFLVPVVLAAATAAVVATTRHDSELAMAGAKVFGLVAIGLVAVLVIERGPDMFALEYDKVSVVHFVAAVVAVAFFVGLSIALRFALHPWLSLMSVAVVAAAVLIAAFPELSGGPFVDVDPRVKELWLYRVTELLPLWRVGGWTTGTFLVGPILVGLVAGLWEVRRSEPTPPWITIVLCWLGAYLLLTVFQARWAMFGQILAIPLLLQGIHRWYERLGQRRSAFILRPLLVVTLIFGPQLLATGTNTAIASAPIPSVSCQLDDVVPTLRLQAQSTVLADQDAGPEILYRTEHRVIATPYHRNEDGILFAHNVMGRTEEQQIRSALAARDVGLILLCPGARDLLQPAEIEGTFYQTLIEKKNPSFVRSVPLPDETDYLLFAVEA